MAKQAVQGAIERIKALEAERNTLLEQAKKEALDQAQLAVEQLNSLGFNYRLIKERQKRTKRGTKRAKASGACSICNFQTNPPHDGRKHRSQKTKKPFTADELKELGLQRVD